MQRDLARFGGINLEDISAPRCFEIEDKLRETLDMPVFHDDQHGTAIVVSAALLNARQAARLPHGRTADRRSTAPARPGSPSPSCCSRSAPATSSSATGKARSTSAAREHMDFSKLEIARAHQQERRKGTLADVIAGSDVFIGLSAGGTLTPEMIRTMAPNPIVFALANPTPEITPDLAREAGALAVATGRSDYPNQVNNSLAFPGVFRGALDVKARTINDEMKIAAAHAIAELVDAGRADARIPDPRQPRPAGRAAGRRRRRRGDQPAAWPKPIDPREIEMRCRDLVYEGTIAL